MNGWLFESKYDINAAIELFLHGEGRHAYPMYLLGLVLPLTRGGSLHLAALVAHGGGVVGAFGKREENRRRRGDTEFQCSGSYDAEGLATDSEIWFSRFNGWSQFRRCYTARDMASKIVDVRLLLGRHEQSLQSDVRELRRSTSGHAAIDNAARNVDRYDSVAFTTAVALLDVAEVVAIEPIAFSARELEPWTETVPPWVLALFMRTPYRAELSTEGLPPDAAVSIREALLNARAVELIDRRASAVLLRSGAEVLLDVISEYLELNLDGRNLSARTDALEKFWVEHPPTPPPSGDPRPIVTSQKAIRAQILASLHVIRDTGNRVHGSAPVEPNALATAVKEYEQLVAAIRELLNDVQSS